MTTEKQIEANRRNAQNSTGPTSVEGKEAVRFNALSFGAHAKTIVLPAEDRQEFERLLYVLFELFEPQNPIEERCVREIGALWWKLERLNRGEQAHLSDQIHLEAARRQYQSESQGIVLVPGLVEVHKRIEQELLKKGLELDPGEEDLREALKRSLTDPDLIAIGERVDRAHRHLFRSLKRVGETLGVMQARRRTIEGQAKRATAA